MQDLIVQPQGMVTLALNQMGNATFNCECTVGNECRQPYWSIENEGNTITTNDKKDIDSFDERGITYSNPTTTTAVISIPDTVENNNTKISCVAFLFGGTEFSTPVKLIIIGESECLTVYCNPRDQSIIILLIPFRSPSTS